MSRAPSTPADSRSLAIAGFLVDEHVACRAVMDRRATSRHLRTRVFC